MLRGLPTFFVQSSQLGGAVMVSKSTSFGNSMFK